jgi:hypothetical protein
VLDDAWDSIHGLIVRIPETKTAFLTTCKADNPFHTATLSEEFSVQHAVSDKLDGMIELDHLVVAARTLEEGHEYVREKLGFETQPGGKHERMGTHNRLLRLGSGTYLEVIAVDPDGRVPFQPRWFGLDDPTMRESLQSGPHLIHWVARTDNLERDADPDVFGMIHPMERGAYRWHITIPSDGHLPFDGCVPTLIRWDMPQHPAQALPDVGAYLEHLRIQHPEPAQIQTMLNKLGWSTQVGSGHARLEAVIKTPSGTRILM